MTKLHIGIIFGGVSLEYDISLQSAENIACVIDRNRFVVVMIRIDKNGIWHRDDDRLNIITFSKYLKKCVCNIVSQFKDCFNKKISRYKTSVFTHGNDSCAILSDLDVVFPIIHGKLGEDGSLQGLLKMQQIPFVGTGVLGSAISMDKDISKQLLRAAGLMVAPFITLTDFNRKLDFEYYADNLGLPFFVKPANQGSSIGVSKVIDRKSFYPAIDLAFNLDRKVLIESAIIGRELECAVLGNHNPKISVCGEILLDKNSFYTYQSKYSYDKEYAKIIIPAKITSEISDRIYSVVLRAFRVLQCSGMARVDFFLTADGCVIINEVNTLPGFTINSMYPRLWEASGLSYKELLSTLIDLALESWEEDRKFFNMCLS